MLARSICRDDVKYNITIREDSVAEGEQVPVGENCKLAGQYWPEDGDAICLQGVR